MSYPAAAWIIANLLMTHTCSSKFKQKQFSSTSLSSILALNYPVRALCRQHLHYCHQTVVHCKWTSANADKFEVMFFGTSAQLKSTLSVNVVTVAGSFLPVTTEMRSLALILDIRLSFDNHVTVVCRTCNYHMGAASHLLVAARWRSSNTSLQHCYNSPWLLQLTYVQHIQLKLSVASESANSLSRVVLQVPWLTHTIPLLRSLHWLPVAQRITFKLIFIPYNVKNTSMPSYLHS